MVLARGARPGSLFYGQAHGRGVLGEVTAAKELSDVRELPEGTFATDWTGITNV